MGPWGYYLKLPIIWFAVWEQAVRSSWIQGYLIAGSSIQTGMNCFGKQWQESTRFCHQLDLLIVWLLRASAETAMPANPVNDLVTQNTDQCTNSDFEGKINFLIPLPWLNQVNIPCNGASYFSTENLRRWWISKGGFWYLKIRDGSAWSVLFLRQVNWL